MFPWGENRADVALVPAMREEMRPHTGLAELGDAQYGVATAAQLRRLEFSTSAIGRWAKCGRLHRVHRGVYAVGRPGLSRHGRCQAALLACGPRSLLSHRSAAWLWGISPLFPWEVEVTVPGSRRRPPGILVHGTRVLGASERVRAERLPVTSVARTLYDVAATGAPKQLERMVERAKRLDLLQIDAIDCLLSERHGSAGSRRLDEAIEIYRDPAFSRSRAELLFLDLVKKGGLSRPALNSWVAGHEIDAYWEVERFAVEVDGWETHGTRLAFESDPVRQEDLKLAGIDSIRVTARRIEREPEVVATRLKILLAQRRRYLSR